MRFLYAAWAWSDLPVTAPGGWVMMAGSSADGTPDEQLLAPARSA